MTTLNKISSSSSSLFKKFSDGLLLNLLLKIKGVIYLPIIINYFNKGEVGQISLILSLSSLFLGLFLLNIPDASNRVILNDKYKENIVINSVNNFLVLQLFLFSILYILLMNFFSFYSKLFYLVTLILILSNAFKKISSYVFQIYQNTKLLLIINVLIEYSSLFLIYIIFKNQFIFSFYFVIYIQVFCIIIGSIFLLIKLYKNIDFKFHIDFEIIKKIFRIAIILLPASYSLVIIQSSDFLIIDYFFNSTLLAEYSFAYSLGSIVLSLSMAITFFWYSTAVVYNKSELKNIINKIFILLPFIYILILIFYYLSIEYIVEIINSNYHNSIEIVKILIVGFFLNVINLIFSGVLYSDKNEKYILFDTIFFAILNIILNIIFIPDYGIKIAALTTTISYSGIYIFRLILLNFLRNDLSSGLYKISNFLIIIISLIYIYIIY
tara:strand:- start:1417 stop:2730 length:1314 start_codon:yes stop_codon:yes gene_type:complete